MMANLRYKPTRHERHSIALDFDGVLGAHPTPGKRPTAKPTDGAVDFVKWLHAQGWKPHVFTARTNHDDVKSWLKKHGFPSLPVTSTKEPAAVYVDDRAMRFTGRFDQLKKRLSRDTTPWHGVG